MSEDEHELGRTQKLNTNSYISVGIAILILAASGSIWKSQYETSLSLASMRSDNAASLAAIRVDAAQNSSDLKSQVANVERELRDKTNDRWTNSDMFRWAVKLQRANQDAAIKIIVPDPEGHTDK